MDVGEDVRRNKANTLATKVAKSDFMQGWLIDNQSAFVETMDLIREGAPVKWAELYMKAYQMGLVKETNINVNINRQQDRENLQALVRSRLPIGVAVEKVYTSFEEVRPEAEALPREKVLP